MKKFKMKATVDPPPPMPPVNLPPPTTHTLHYVGSVRVQTSTYSSDLLDKMLGKFLRKRQRKLSRKGGGGGRGGGGGGGGVRILAQLRRLREREEQQPSSGESTEILHPLESSITSDSVQLATSRVSTLVEFTAPPVSTEVRVPCEMSSIIAKKSPEPGDSASMSSRSIPSLTDRQVHMTHGDSCEVSIKLTRATPERMFAPEEEEGEEEEGGEGEGGEGEEVDLGDLVVDKSTLQCLDRDGDVYSSDNDDNDSHTTGSSTSCTTPDPAQLAGDLTPTDSITPSNSRLAFHERNPRAELVEEEDQRPSSCPPLNTSSACHSGDVGGAWEEETLVGSGEREEETESIETVTNSGVYSLVLEREGVDGGGGGGGGGGNHRGENCKYQRTVPLVRSREEETDASFDTLPQLDSLQQSPLFQALSGPALESSRESGEGGGGGGRRGREEVRLVISPNMVEVHTADSSKMFLRRTIRSVACCTQVGNVTDMIVQIFSRGNRWHGSV